ncbi:alginate lyase family protein [Streptomyces sp. NPDC058247]|uniref:alginate lyase family protein n=1 Tax=Streptomyces sp. NPDC058247 TaxID=3346401 RepID=UPI0036EB7CDF
MGSRFRARLRGAAAAAVAAVVATLLVPAASSASAPDPAGQRALDFGNFMTPKSPVIDGKRFRVARIRLALGDRGLRTDLKSLTKQADSWMEKGPWTVTDKPKPAASGDVHDYLSQAPYFWATQPKTADNPMGCPYAERDGVRNPEASIGTDREDAGNVLQSVQYLTLAWYYTGKKAYAQHAADILRTWFIDPATRMNPNLDYAQGIPCKVTGRSIGIIDFAQYYSDDLDAIALLDTGAPGWTKSDSAAMADWNKRYLDWLVNSPFGKQESAATNNHGTYAAMQIAALAAATGDRALARSTVEVTGKKLIDMQVQADGKMPRELARTRSYHYTTYNLVAFLRLAAIGKQVGVDLWSYTGPQGQSLFKAVDLLLPTATGAEPWPYPELEFLRYEAADIVHQAAEAGDAKARAALPKIQAPPVGDLWGLRPAAQHAI